MKIYFLQQVDADSAIGIPRDEIDYQRKLGHVKVNRMHTFLSHGYAKYMLLVWLTVANLIMLVHDKLFQHGKFYSHRDHTDDISIFDFAGPVHTNPVAQAITRLVSILLDPSGMGRVHLTLWRLKLGEDVHAWPVRITRALQVAILIGVGVLWRKIFRFFKAYPWALARRKSYV